MRWSETTMPIFERCARSTSSASAAELAVITANSGSSAKRKYLQACSSSSTNRTESCR
jgi:hypothetical protein